MKPLVITLLLLSFIGCNDSNKKGNINTENNMETVTKVSSTSYDNNFGKATMHIRKPVSEVFDAFINPEKTTKFWFTKSTGKLEEGKIIHWIWEMYDVSVPVRVLKIIENQQIEIEWGEGTQMSLVQWTFNAVEENITSVTITNSGLQGDGDALMNVVRDSTGGFTMVLAGLKAYLEHNIELNLVKDKSYKL